MNILVNCRGFIGDILFASSVAEKLYEKYPGCVVVYGIPVIQPYLLLKNNPYINEVFVYGSKAPPPLPNEAYEMIINLPEVDQRFPATIQFQAAAGIEDQSVGYKVWTSLEYDDEAFKAIRAIRENHKKPVIGWQANWEYKAYQCTPELLAKRIGAPHRNIERIITELSGKFTMLPMGFNRTIDQFNPVAADPVSYAKTASMIKYCDYFIGSEGGLSNLAAGVGTKTIITTDFIVQLYGPNGHVKQIENPQMGPQVYFPNAGHIYLDPCITDDDIITQIMSTILK